MAHSLAAPQAASGASPRLWGDPWVPGPSVLVKQEGPANSSHFPNGRSTLGFSPGPQDPSLMWSSQAQSITRVFGDRLALSSPGRLPTRLDELLQDEPTCLQV